jgi:two-component system LytT family response regulator
MAKILIVEDELLIANGLAAIIKSIDDELDVIITGYAEEALRYAKNSHYDAFLLDIQLKDYSGLELAKEMREMNNYKLTPIIFITAIPTRELMAFREIHCYDYIVKPFREEEVRKALETIIHYGIKKDDKKKYIRLNQKEYSYLIRQEEIIYIEAKNKKVFMVTTNETIDLSNYTLYKLLDELSEDFVQCHRGYIINISYVEKVDKMNNLIKLKHIDLPVPIGRKYREDLRGKIYEID